MSNNSIWSIDRTLLVATTPGRSGPGSDGNKGILCIPQSSSVTGTTPSDLVLYPGHSLGSLTPLQRCSRCILQAKPTGPQDTRWGSLTLLQYDTHIAKSTSVVQKFSCYLNSSHLRPLPHSAYNEYIEFTQRNYLYFHSFYYEEAS